MKKLLSFGLYMLTIGLHIRCMNLTSTQKNRKAPNPSPNSNTILDIDNFITKLRNLHDENVEAEVVNTKEENEKLKMTILKQQKLISQLNDRLLNQERHTDALQHIYRKHTLKRKEVVERQKNVMAKLKSQINALSTDNQALEEQHFQQTLLIKELQSKETEYTNTIDQLQKLLKENMLLVGCYKKRYAQLSLKHKRTSRQLNNTREQLKESNGKLLEARQRDLKISLHKEITLQTKIRHMKRNHTKKQLEKELIQYQEILKSFNRNLPRMRAVVDTPHGFLARMFKDGIPIEEKEARLRSKIAYLQKKIPEKLKNKKPGN